MIKFKPYHKTVVGGTIMAMKKNVPAIMEQKIAARINERADEFPTCPAGHTSEVEVFVKLDTSAGSKISFETGDVCCKLYSDTLKEYLQSMRS